MARKPALLWFIRMMAGIFFFPFFNMIVRGQDLLPKNGAFILLPKHQRWEDIPLLALATPFPLYYVAKYELFQTPLSRWFISSLGGIPLHRRHPLESRHSLRSIMGLLEKGEKLVIFPEGTFFKDCMGPGHAGLVRMVYSRVSVPFIPVGIRYSKNRIRKQVSITFGRPVQHKGSENAMSLFHQVMKEIARLSGLTVS